MKLLIIGLAIFASVAGDYDTDRAKLLEEEKAIAIGGDIVLTPKEELVNQCLMEHKLKELDSAFSNQELYNMTYHYFLYKDYIQNRSTYQIINDMPKGAVLHVHDVAIMGPDYIMKLTYLDNLYICQDDNTVSFVFATNSSRPGCSEWKLLSDLRKSSKDVKEFDKKLREYFTMVVEDPAEVYPNIIATWNIFERCLRNARNLLTYRPVWEQYFYDALKGFRDENIMYVEVRSTFPELYELDGTVHDITVTGLTYKKAIERFIKDYPDFYGAKVIYAPSRHVNNSELTIYLEQAKKIKNAIGSTFAGFDLVGYENGGVGPLLGFAPELLKASSYLDYFFHAAETNWYGTVVDNNLVDAILLGAKRLGHAYALSKHPRLIKEVQEKGIGLEINVISNNVLSLVKDLRNHPLAQYIANGLPVVISSDDPGCWEADFISQDFYVAFVGVASRQADLTLLKQFAINSLKYSALDGAEKITALKMFEIEWDAFVDDFDCSKYLTFVE